MVCAVISDQSGRYLVARRPQGKALAGKWEFPGGKVEPGEEPSEALGREIWEELGVAISVMGPLTEVVHHDNTSCIRLLPFSARLNDGVPRAIEHEAIRWVSPQELITLDLADADIPIVRQLSTLP